MRKIANRRSCCEFLLASVIAFAFPAEVTHAEVGYSDSIRIWSSDDSAEPGFELPPLSFPPAGFNEDAVNQYIAYPHHIHLSSEKTIVSAILRIQIKWAGGPTAQAPDGRILPTEMILLDDYVDGIRSTGWGTTWILPDAEDAAGPGAWTTIEYDLGALGILDRLNDRSLHIIIKDDTAINYSRLSVTFVSPAASPRVLVDGYVLDELASVPDPGGLASDSAGNIYVGNTNPVGRVRRVDSRTGSVIEYGQDIDDPDALVADVAGHLGPLNAIYVGGRLLTGESRITRIVDGTNEVYAEAPEFGNPSGLEVSDDRYLLAWNGRINTGGELRSALVRTDGTNTEELVVFVDNDWRSGLTADMNGLVYTAALQGQAIYQLTQSGEIINQQFLQDLLWVTEIVGTKNVGAWGDALIMTESGTGKILLADIATQSIQPIVEGLRTPSSVTVLPDGSVAFGDVEDGLIYILRAGNALDDGLVGYWALDEGTGDTAYDYSGDDNDGTIHGASWTEGPSGFGLSFDGEDDFVDLPGSSSLQFENQSLTVSLWVKLIDNTDLYRWFLVLGDTDAAPRICLAKHRSGAGNGSLFFEVRSAANIVGRATSPIPGEDLPYGRWSHVAGVVDYDESTLALYVDGVRQGAASLPVFDLADAGDLLAFIGRCTHSPSIHGEYHEGLLDEVRIYNRALSATEVLQLYQETGNHLTVGGTVRFVADDGQTYPAKHVEVNVYDENVVLFDELIVSGYTDENGDFYFDRDGDGDLIWNEDSELFGGAIDIYLKITARNEAAIVSSWMWPTPAYAWQTETITNVDGGLVNLGVLRVEDDGLTLSFLSAALEARRWMESTVGYSPDQKRIVFPFGEKPAWDEAHQVIVMPTRLDYPVNTREYSSGVYHEYGHGLHDEVRPFLGLPGQYQGATGGPNSESDEGTALSEGWAEFFQMAVAHGPFEMPQADWYWASVERGSMWSDLPSKDGNIVEGSIASILWDLYDSANDDDVDQQLTRIWTVLADDDPDRMWSPSGDDDFYTYWVNRYGLDQPGSEAEWRAFDEIFIDQGIPVRDDSADTVGDGNDSMATAFDLGALSAPGTEHPNLICVDDDWWSFTLTSTGSATDSVTVSFDWVKGYLDLFVYDNALALIGSSTGSTGVASVSLNGKLAGTYYAQVVGQNGDYSPNYTLSVHFSDPMSVTPNDLDLPAAYDTGRYDTDDITITSLPHIVGFATPNATVRIYKGPSGSYALIGTDTADPGGQFDVMLTAPLDEGLNEITATAEEAGKLESEHSGPPMLITLDTQPPDQPSMPDMTRGTDSGRFLNDDVTNVETPTFQGNAEVESEVTLYEGASPLGSEITSTGAWSITSSLLGEGAHQISATAIDVAGNESTASDVLSVLVDVTAPVITGPSVIPTNCPHPGAVFDLQITASDALSGVQDAWNPQATVRLVDTMIDDLSLNSLGGDLFGSSWVTTNQEPGTYAVDFEAWDLAGNSQQLLEGAAICLAVPADLDEDGDVDLDDFSIFAGCMMGPGVAYPGECEFADLDKDVDVALMDFRAFQQSFGAQ